MPQMLQRHLFLNLWTRCDHQIFLKGKMADGLFCMYSQPQPPGVMLPARRVQLKGLTPGQRVSWGLNMFFFPKCFRHTDSVDLELCLVSDHTNESSWQKFHNEKTKIPVISFCKKDGWPFKIFFFYVCNLINLMRLQSTQLGMGVTIVIHQTFIRSWMFFYSFFIIADRSSVLCAFLNLFKWIHKFHIPCHLYQK